MAFTAGIVTECSPPSTTGIAPPAMICEMSACARWNVFAALPSTTEQSPQSTRLDSSTRSKSNIAWYVVVMHDTSRICARPQLAPVREMLVPSKGRP